MTDETPPFITGRVYLLGPMSGIPEFTATAFREAAATLRAQGWDVISPVELDEESGFEHEGAEGHEVTETEYLDFLRRDLQRVLSDDGVQGGIALPGWENSRGAALEVHVLRELGKPIFAYPTLEPLKRPSNYRPPSEESILEEAQRLVHGARGDDYGHPAEDFARTSGAAAALGIDPAARPEDVPLFMVLVKLSRLRETPNKRDSAVDVAGYIETYAMTLERNGNGLR